MKKLRIVADREAVKGKLATLYGSEQEIRARHTAFMAATQQVRVLEHEIKSLVVRRGYGKIKSSANGIVSKRLAESGDMAGPGRPLYKITSSSRAIARAELPQSILQKVHIGTPMEL